MHSKKWSNLGHAIVQREERFFGGHRWAGIAPFLAMHGELASKFGVVGRIRHELAYATHTYFKENGFRIAHTPVTTTSDFEGACQTLQGTYLFSEAEKIETELTQNTPQESDIEAARIIVKEKGELVSQMKSLKASKDEVLGAVSELTKAIECSAKLEDTFNVNSGIPRMEGKLEYFHVFSGRQASLTVSEQLYLETCSRVLGNVYTFCPTFTAKHSHTSRHLKEFWMVEALIKANLEDYMNYAERYVKFLCKWLLKYCLGDMEAMVKKLDKTAIERLKLVLSMPFERVPYTKAVQLLENVTDEFENRIEWGVDLASEHERYLTDVVFKKPVIVYDYPISIKAFYMRLNDDGKTVAAMDVLLPKVGKLIGGSQREERLDVLERREFKDDD